MTDEVQGIIPAEGAKELVPLPAKTEAHDSADNLYQRLRKARLEIASVPKRGQADSAAGKYPFVTHDDAVNAVVPPLLRHGVLPIHRPKPETRAQEWLERGANKAAMGFTAVDSELLLVNVDKPEEVLTVPSFGYGLDTQDKGPGKAMSYAKKYAILNALCLQTGEDVETGNADAVPPRTRARAASDHHTESDPVLRAMWTAVRGADIADDTLRLYMDRRFQKASTKDLAPEQLREVTKWANELPKMKRAFASEVKAAGTDGSVLLRTAVSLNGVRVADIMTVEEWQALIASAKELADESAPWDEPNGDEQEGQE